MLALFVSQCPFLWSALFNACAMLYTCLNGSAMPHCAAPRCVTKLRFAISAVIVFIYFLPDIFVLRLFFSLLHLKVHLYVCVCVCMGLLLSRTVLASHFFSKFKILMLASFL